MGVSFGVVIGLVIILIGAGLLGTRQKKLAGALIGAGAAVALITIGVIVLAVHSGM
jgi:hypothetical protein